jgi:hypothetical protein
MFLSQPLNSTIKCMAETCIRGLRMEGVNTVFANFNENWQSGVVSRVQTGRCRASLLHDLRQSAASAHQTLT